MHWTERPLALTPQPFEVGCWSGSFVMDGDTPRILYTRVAGEDWGRGEVAIAQGDPSATRWTTGPDDVVIAGPPAELGVRTFRDPYIFRSGAGWTMIMAAGLDNGAGAALQYRSADLRTWSYDGVLCSRPSNRADDVWSGALWECPQLFPLGSRWVLLISVWDADILHYVAAAVGDYDGATFTPDTWQRLTYGTSAYAMTTFLDREGRRSVLSWLREEPQNNPPSLDALVRTQCPQPSSSLLTDCLACLLTPTSAPSAPTSRLRPPMVTSRSASSPTRSLSLSPPSLGSPSTSRLRREPC